MDALKIGLIALAMAGCTITSIESPMATSTANVASSAIVVTVNFVRSNGLVAQAQVELLVNGQHGSLGPNDALIVKDSLGNARALEDDGAILGGEYQAEIPTSDTALEIDFVRAGVVVRTIDAPLPPPFVIAAPATTSRKSGIAIAWSAAPAFPMEIVATGEPCLPPQGFTAHLEPDTGTFAIQGADMFTVPGSCEVTIVATRGTADTQVRTVVVETQP
jgi:hypothetical protein